MVQAQSYSYLDLSVHPDLSPFVLSADATVLFSSAIDKILWSNFAGAALFGGNGIVDLLEAKLTESQTFVRQLRNAVGQIEDNQPIVRGFRISIGLRSALMQFEILPIVLLDGNTCYRVSQKGQNQDQLNNEFESAQKAVQSLEGFADAAAILDDFGMPVSSSGNFESLGPDEAVLGDLITELKSESDRLIKREINSVDGKTVAAGLGRLSDSPPRNLMVLASVHADTELETDIETDQTTSSPQTDDDFERADSRTHETLVNDSTDNAVTEVTENPITGNVPKEIDEPDSRRPASEVVHFDESTHEDTSFSEDTLPNLEAADVESNAETGGEHVRFAWATDSNAVFTEVSPELENAVGNIAADIVGRRWHDISTVFGFDTNREIATLLEKQDTWSGKTVLWPVQSTDMVVPVDLAALPAFNSDRKFSGFRGFGIIRTVDAIVDPEETGLALADSAPEETAEDRDIKPDEKEENIRLKAREDDAENVPDQEASNIIPIKPGSIRSDNDQLTSSETDAFEKIGERLKTEFGDRTSPPRPLKPGKIKKPDTSLIEKLPVAILIYRNGESLFANQRFLDVTGYENLEALNDAGGVEALFNPGIHADDHQDGEYRLTRSDGKTLSVNPVLHKVPWDDASALQLSFSIPQDASQNLPEALDITHASEIQSILDITSDGIILLKDNGEIISINSSAEALFNKSFDETVGHHMTSLFAEESHGEINQYINGLATPGIEGLLQEGREVIAAESNGGMIPVLLTIAPLKSSGKLCAVIRDMTSWKQTEQELIKSRRDAERSSEQKTDFLAQVSHEVRIPLTAIIGFSDIMIEERFGPINNERYREYLRDIKRSGQHVLDLVNDLLDLSKIEAGKLELSFDAIDLNDVATEAVAMLQPHANSNRIIIRTSLSRSVPKVVADLRSIRQVILNLVTNAIKFSPSNSQVIVSTVYESSGEVALRVRDTGSGMSENEIEEAMKPYNQLSNIAEKTGQGTGLGLPLTKALVEANRAYFDLDSEPGKGTIAHVQFPIQRVLAD